MCAGNSLRGATGGISQLRAQLAKAEEAEDKPAIIELSGRLVALAPTDFETWEKLVRAQFGIEDFDRCEQSLDAWQKAVKQPPAVIEDLRGDVFFARKDYKNAEQHWLAFIAKKPAPADAVVTYEALADLCVAQARWRDNLEFRTRVISLQESAANRVARATALLRLHRWDEAFADMAKANKIDSTDAQVKEWLPQFERLEKFLPKIKALDARIAKSPNDFSLLLGRARLFALAERPLLALDDCEHAMKLQPGSMRARIQTGEALLDEKRVADAAKLQVSQNLARGESTHVSEQALRELGEKDAQILQTPGKPEPLAARSKVLRALNQFTLALADARAALAIDDKSASAHFEEAHDFDGLNQPREALAHAAKATELNPSDAVAWFYRGILEAQRADFAAAIESQTRSLNIRESLVALREREKCLRRTGKIDKADADRKRIRELDPGTE